MSGSDVKADLLVADHQAALNEMDRQMKVQLDTPEGEWLGVLATHAEAWEEMHHGPLALGFR